MVECVRASIHFSRIRKLPGLGIIPIAEIESRRVLLVRFVLPHLLWNALKIERVRSQTNARMAQIATRPRGLERTLDATTTCNKVIGVRV